MKVTVAPNGDVTLDGLVAVPSESRAATEDATHAGAARVVNRLRVAPPPPR